MCYLISVLSLALAEFWQLSVGFMLSTHTLDMVLFLGAFVLLMIKH